MKSPAILMALSLALSSLGLVYFFSENPFEFTQQNCDPGPVADWRDVLTSGCVELGYAARFIGIYGALIFASLLASWGLYRLSMRAD